MTIPALLLLLVPAVPVDEVFEIPASEWRYVELNLNREPVMLTCRFESEAGGAFQLALLGAEDLHRKRRRQPHETMAATPPGPRGRMLHAVREPGDYYVVVENRERRPARVRLVVSVAEPAARTLSTRRRAVVVALSCAVFLGIVLCAGGRLLRGLRK